MARSLLSLLNCLSISMVLAQAPAFEHAWQPAGQPLISEAVAVTTDADGNIYTAGHFVGSGDFDPGPGVVTLTSASALNNDAFVTKMNAAGELIWARRFGGTNHEWVTGLVVDSLGGAITCGRHNGVAEMDPGPANYDLPYGGADDIFIQKLDADGNFVFAHGIGAEGYDVPYGMVKGPDDMIYIGGLFGGDMVDFGPNILQTGGVTEAFDGFILKMYPDGGIDWAKRIGNTADDYVTDLALDQNGDIIFTGTFTSYDADFDPSSNWATLEPVGLKDAFLCKWTGDGQYLWAMQMGGSDDDIGLGITVDAAGNIHTTGTFHDACDFNLAGEGYVLYSAGNRDMFVTKHDPDGAFLWAKRMGGEGWDEGRDVQLDAAGEVVATGFFTGTVDMDPGAGTQSRTAAGLTDLFLLGLHANGTYAWDIALGSTDSDHANGLHSSGAGDLFAVGRHSATMDADPGPGTFSLTTGTQRAWAMRFGVCTPVEGPATTAIACDSYAWEGSTYTESGIYHVVHPSATGCDSTVTLTLTVNGTSSSFSTASACDSYTWNGEDYDASGIYMATFTNAGGCDSTATLQLTITTVNVDVLDADPTLTAELSGAAYQWVDCGSGNEPIIGATGQSFTPEQNGNYAVEITFGICTAVSDCYQVLSTGLLEQVQGEAALHVSPNPGEGLVRVQRTDGLPITAVHVRDASGRMVRTAAGLGSPSMQIDLSGLPAGLYTLECMARDGVQRARWIKQ